MKHLTTIADIEQAIKDHSLCLFFIKAPDCGVCNVMLDKVGKLAESFPSLCSFYTDIMEEPLIAGRFLVYSGPTVLLLMEGKEVYRGVQFINLKELKQTVNRYFYLCSDKADFITSENICIDGGMTRLMIYHEDNDWRLE